MDWLDRGEPGASKIVDYGGDSDIDNLVKGEGRGEAHPLPADRFLRSKLSSILPIQHGAFNLRSEYLALARQKICLLCRLF